MRGLSSKESKTFSDIIYVANTDPLSPAGWLETISLLRYAIDADACGVMVADASFSRVLQYVTDDLSEKFENAYAEHYIAIDPVPHAAMSLGKLVCRPTDVLPREAWRNSELFNDLLEPHGIIFSLNMGITAPPENPLSLHLLRADRSRDFSDRDVQFLELLLPHITSAYNKAKHAQEVESLHEALLAHAEQISASDGLTQREVQVCSLISKGLSNKDIAKALFISETTVKAHVRNIFNKMQVSNRAQVASKAYNI